MFLFCSIILALTLLALIFILRPLVLTSSHVTATTIAFLLPIFSISLYLYWGRGKDIAQWIYTHKHAEEVKKEINKYGSRQAIISALKKRLEELPTNKNNAKGWYILGKLYLSDKKIAESLYALHQAVILNPNDPEFILQYVMVNFLAHQSRLDNSDKEMLNKILAIDSDNINAINLLALDAYYQKNYAQAIGYWERLLKYFSPDSNDEKSLLEMINLAQNKLAASKISSIQSVRVTITLSKQLQNKLTDADTLFVYALAAQGPRIPLAVSRRSQIALPCTVVLDSSQAMLPGYSLATAKKVFVEARLSRTGNAMPMKGDLIGRSKIVEIGKETILSINIDEIVK